MGGCGENLNFINVWGDRTVGLFQGQKNLNANYAKRRITRKNLFKFAKFVNSKNSRSKHAAEIKTRQVTLEKPWGGRWTIVYHLPEQT